MFSKHQKVISLISVHADPAIAIDRIEASKKVYVNGQSVYVGTLGIELSKQGFSVDMFTRKTSSEQPTIVKHNDNCRTIRLKTNREDFIERDELFEELPTFVRALINFQQRFKIQYEVVHTNYWLSAWVGMQLKKILGVKQVHTYHSLGAVKYQSVSIVPPIADTRLAVEKTCLETADYIVATSPQEREHLRSLISLKGNIKLIPCGTNVHKFGSISRQNARQKLAISQDSKVVLYVGRFDSRKGIEALVRAVSHSQFRKWTNSKLMLVGGGYLSGENDAKELAKIQTLIKQLGIDNLTSFYIHIYHDDLPAYYAAADVCVVPSHYEPFGLVAIEAMACGIPVIASNVGGLQFTVIPQETGLLIPPKDDVALAEAIDKILINSEWRDKLGQKAQKRVRELFSLENEAKQLGKLYYNLT